MARLSPLSLILIIIIYKYNNRVVGSDRTHQQMIDHTRSVLGFYTVEKAIAS